MSTRSIIARENQDGTISAIYCQGDGYLENNGVILNEHYQDAAKVDQLIGLGSISSLGPEIGEKHPFDSRYDFQEGYKPEYKHWTTAYGRDRGQEGTAAKTYAGREVLLSEEVQDDYWAEYTYLFSAGTWLVSCEYTEDKFLDLKEALAKSEQEVED